MQKKKEPFVFNFVTLRKQLPTTALNGGKTESRGDELY